MESLYRFLGSRARHATPAAMGRFRAGRMVALEVVDGNQIFRGDDVLQTLCARVQRIFGDSGAQALGCVVALAWFLLVTVVAPPRSPAVALPTADGAAATLRPGYP